jgi:hypothetical protein
MKSSILNQKSAVKSFRSAFSSILAAIIILGSYSCKKHECPMPDSTTTTVYVATLQPGSEGKDALLSGLSPASNYGNYLSLHARAWTVGGSLSLEKGILQFDYSSIPAGATITKATLTLYADTTENYGTVGHSTLSGPNDWTLKRVTQAWSETSVTWNTEPTTDNVNVIQCAASTSPSQAYVFDLTSWVKDEILNPTSYYGFLMQINNQTPYRAIYFYSSDHPYSSLHPKMVVEYTK